ncbi:E2F/DP family winged-helix DNA-binding domain-containing protein [Halteromyces radiatus]|uniref:E2F/DP family winged-helix DNA-binding domain-containing protein n=1 Tax=Halteromyces radiatus TaxID=101107 RepID=UPI00221E70B9|nr:E2F/DP family winged-helix DNA-binding domain-containing protein [Halteromyces radiatus]KAI8097315.1 E2F/DP family winged-helix DNA-binding domain-containing protein [Halteromyces radiatus]
MSAYQPYSSFSYTSLPSPPLNDRCHPDNIKTSAVSHYAMTLSSPHQQRDHSNLDLELRPLSLAKLDTNNSTPYLPSIHHVVLSPPPSSASPPLSYTFTGGSSPDSFSDSLFSSPPTSSSPSFSPSVTPPVVHTPHLSDSCSSTPNSTPSQRKGSIASLLNSDPELKLLDEEEHKYGYQTHFMNAGVKRRLSIHCDQQSSSLPDQAPKRKKPCNKQHRRQQQQQQNGSTPYSSTTTSIICTSNASSPSLVLNERATKGLRHFSKQVCDKVKEHGVTTYDQVVQELTSDLTKSATFCQFDQKNIRRRVYDALNVLMAMNIIVKDKKEIKWLGIPSCYHPSSSSTDIIMNDLNHDRNDDEDDDDMLLLKQQIQMEEAQKEKWLATCTSTRTVLGDTLKMYLQLRRLIWRNQHELGHEPMTALPFMIVNPMVDNNEEPLVTLSEDQKQAIITFDHQQHAHCPIFKDTDILDHQFGRRFTPQELSSWLPDATWHRYLDVSS